MRIEKLVIEDLTSLRGRHEINFKKDLAQQDLFAITGPTGSGKSTLLNSISLALYGRSAKTELSSQDFVALGCAQGRVELSFSHQKTLYKAHWSCRILGKNNKALKRPQVQRDFYAKEDGHWTALENKPEDLIGLDYEQFSKSVILNQGEFARFLTSSFSDRRQILERLYNGENLSALKQTLNQKVKKAKEEFYLLEQKSKGLLPFGAEDYNQFKEEYTKLKSELQKKEKEDTQLQEINQEFKRLIELLRSFERTYQRLENYQKILTQQDQSAIQLKKVYSQIEKDLFACKESLKTKRPQIERGLKTLESQNNLQQILSEYNSRLSQLTRQGKAKKEETAKVENDKETINGQIEQIKSKWPESFSVLDEQSLNQKREELSKIITLLKDLEKVEYNEHTQIDMLKTQVDELGQQSQEAGPELKNLEKRLKELEDERKNTLPPYETLNQLKEQLATVEQKSYMIEQLLTNKQSCEENQNKIKKQLPEIEAETQRLSSTAEDLTKEIRDIEKWVELNQLQASLKSCIEQSLKEDQCYVCRRPIDEKILEHPLLKEEFSPDLGAKKSKERQLEEVKNQLNSQELHQRQLGEALESAQKELQELHEQIHKYLKDLDIKQRDDILAKNILQQLQELKKTLQSKEKKVQQQEIESEKLKIQQVQTKRNFSRIEEALKEKQNNIKIKDQKIKELTSDKQKHLCSIDLFEEQEQGKLSEIESFYEQLNLYLQKKERLPALTERLKGLEKDISDLKHDYSLTQKNIATTNQQLEENHGLLTEIAQDLEIDELNSERLQKFMAKLEQEVETQESQKTQTSQTLQKAQQDLVQTQNSISLQKEQLNEIITTSRIHQAHIFQQLDKLGQAYFDEEAKRWAKKIDQLDLEKIQEHEKEALLAFYDDHFSRLLSETAAQKTKVTEVFHQVQANIQLYDQKIREQEELEGQLLEVKKKKELLDQLYELIGRDEFRNFALGLIEHDLIQLTNHELENMCEGRYRIDIAPTNRAQEFILIDYWQGGSERKVSTLSGGETFLVSLAMALSLAEMSRGETQIDSFFIDEGFGSLDHDSLDEVIETLFHVRARGKQIGIISHVKELTQRIDVNIDLVKNQLGHSTIQILHN